MTSSTDARAAVQGLVAALDRGDADAFCAALAPDVTFLLSRSVAPLRGREDLRGAWEAWTAAGNRILACRAWDLDVRAASDALATATHVLSFHLEGVAEPLRRRETLVLQRDDDGRWLVVHGHRSLHPYEWAGGRLRTTVGAAAGAELAGAA
jgi:uncharacterized protein (TIGR02246 family)